MRHKHKFIISYTLLIGCICVACAPVTGLPWEQMRGAPTPEPVEIMLVSYRRDVGQDPIIQDFVDQRPDITVTSYPAGRWGWGNTLVDHIRQSATRSGDELGIPDVIHTRADFLASLGEEGYLLDLSPFLHAAGDPALESFFPELIEPLKMGDQVFVLPVSVDPVMLFYNAELFAEKGVTPPTAEWTWDDLLQAAVQLAEPQAVPPVYGLLVLDVVPLIYQNGGTLVDDPLAPTQFTLNSDETVEAISWIVDLDKFYNVSPPADRMMRREGEAFTTVSEGRVAMWIANMSFRHYVGDGTTWSFQLGVAPLPQGRYRATVGTVEGIAILKNTTNLRACWDFVHYFVTHLPPGVGPLAQLPASRTLAESQEFLSRMPEKGVESYEQSLSFLMPPLSLPGGVEWQLNGILQRNLERVFSSDVDPRDALEAAQREADKMLTVQLMQ